MYTSFYKLDSKPFENSPDPSFLWLGEKHKEVFSTLRYGLLENKGFLFLEGEVGVGKTTLINSLIQVLDSDVEQAVIADPRLERIDFYNVVARGFGIEKRFTSKVQFLIQFSHFLHKADDENKKVLLVVDDCHLLTQEMLEELILLSNIEKAETKLINIYYVGQHEFNDMLVQPKNRAIQQRLTLRLALEPLKISEAEDYIRHRLKVAGKTEKLFAAKAVQLIHHYSQGVPEHINIICDHALATGSIQGKHLIDHKVIEECIKKLNLPKMPDRKDLDALTDDSGDLESFKEQFTTGAVQSPSRVSGFNIEGDDKQGRWLLYGLGACLVLAIGVYSWFSGHQAIDTVQVDPVVAEQPPPPEEVLDQGNSLPAIAMLEESKNEINEKKAAELKAAILANAYKDTESEQKEEILQPDDANKGGGENVVRVSPLVESADNVAVENISAGKDTLAEEVVTARDTVSKVQKLPADLQGNQKKDMEQVDQLVPLEPGKVVLGLQPDSLELTETASNEFLSFVGRLKEYPGVMVLVKGFVSSVSNSPANIELSLKRAQTVQKLLVANGIKADQIEVRGMGNQEQLAPNTTRAGRTKNRRVEIIVTSNGL